MPVRFALFCSLSFVFARPWQPFDCVLVEWSRCSPAGPPVFKGQSTARWHLELTGTSPICLECTLRASVEGISHGIGIQQAQDEGGSGGPLHPAGQHLSSSCLPMCLIHPRSADIGATVTVVSNRRDPALPQPSILTPSAGASWVSFVRSSTPTPRKRSVRLRFCLVSCCVHDLHKFRSDDDRLTPDPSGSPAPGTPGRRSRRL